MVDESNLSQYLRVNVGEQLILLSLQVVKIILPLPSLHDVPHQTKGLQGILNYHGKSVPVYNLGVLIDGEAVPFAVDTPLILCEIHSEIFGLLVSQVDEVLEIATQHIQSLSLANLPSFVKGTYEASSSSMWVLELAGLIDLSSLKEAAEYE